MWLTFGITTIIAGSWFIKMIRLRRIFIQRTPLDIPIALFISSQVISTIFSWDSHVSFWGYYSRFNGGLLSIVSYVFLYYAFVSNFRNEQARGDASGGVQRRASAFAVPRSGTRLAGAPLDERAAGPRALDATIMVKRLLFVSLLSGLVVALWGLPSHFGYDPTCLLFRGTLDVSCWTEDFQPKIRIFSTLGQPDWLAAYLTILIPISIAMFIKRIVSHLTSDKKYKVLCIMYYVSKKYFILATLYLLLATLFYLDLLYTGARSGFLAVWVSLGFFLATYLWLNKKKFYILHSTFYILLVLVLVTFFIGQPFEQLNKFTFDGIKKSFFTLKVDNTVPQSQTKAPHLGELGGTDSGQIRKIVWQGAFNAWKNYPIFGTGVETFAFAYYKYKLPQHNLTSEWNFLYNKAHNEYLNYLATTGAFGLGTYILMIVWFIFLAFRRVILNSFQDLISRKSEMLKQVQHDKTLIAALVAAYVSILITNFFGFSVVITNIYLFLIPAFIFTLGNMMNPENVFVFPANKPKSEKASAIQWVAIFILILTALYLIFDLIRFWVADTNYAYGQNLDKAGQHQQANPYLRQAANTRNDEPVFKDALSINDANVAVYLLNANSTVGSDTGKLASEFVQEAINLSTDITSKHPNNVVFWKNRVRVFYSLSQKDSRYLDFALSAIKTAEELAPNDASISYNLGIIYGQAGDVKMGIKTLENTIRLKPDYRDAHFALGLFYHDQAVDENGNVVDRDKLDKAIAQLQYILDNFGEDKVVKETLKQWKKL